VNVFLIIKNKDSEFVGIIMKNLELQAKLYLELQAKYKLELQAKLYLELQAKYKLELQAKLYLELQAKYSLE